MDKPQLWSKNFLLVSAVNFFLYFTFYLLMVTIGVFAEDRFHASPSAAGLVAGIFVIGILIARLFSGRYIDSTGAKKLLFIGFIACVITTALYFVVNSMTLLLIDRFLNGAAVGIASTATGTIVAKVIPNERRGEGTGYYGLSMTIAMALGPFIGMYITLHTNFYMNFFVCTVLLFLSFFATFFIRMPKLTLVKDPQKPKTKFSIHNYFEKNALPISIFSFFIALGYSGILSFISGYVKAINLIEAGSFFFIVYSISILFSRPFMGILFDRKGANFIVYPMILVFALAMGFLSTVTQGWALLLAAVLVGIGYGSLFTTTQAIAIKSAEPHRIGLATTTIYIFLDLGVGLGPSLLGTLIPLTGFRNTYILIAIMLFLTLPLYYFLHGRKQKTAA